MNIQQRLPALFHSLLLRRAILGINLSLFFIVSFLSLSLDMRYPFNVINIGLVGLFTLGTILYLLLVRAKPRISLFLICEIGLLFWMLLSYVANGFGEFPQTPVLMVILSLIIYLWLTTNRRQIPLFLFVFLLASWCFVAYFTAVYFSAVIRPNLGNRIGSAFGNENDVARHLVFAFLINGYFCYRSRKVVLKVISGMGGLLSFYLLILTGSMSNLFLAVISVAIFAFVLVKKRGKIWAGIGIGLALVALAVLLFTMPALSSIKDRLLAIVNAFFGTDGRNIDSSTVSRIRGAKYGFKLLFESPLFGNGPNSVYSNYKIMAHNNLAAMGADYGLPALIIEETLILYPLFGQKRATKKEIVFILTFGFYIFGVQFVLVTFNSKIEAIMIPIIYTLMGADRSFVRTWQTNRGYLPTYRARIK